MTTSATLPKKALAGLAAPPLKPASFLATVRSTKGNPFEIVPLAAFEQPIYLSKWLLGPVLMVNDPEGVRRVVRDHADHGDVQGACPARVPQDLEREEVRRDDRGLFPAPGEQR